MKKLYFVFLMFGWSLACASEWDVGANSRSRFEGLHAGNVIEGIVVQCRPVSIAPTMATNAVATSVGGIVGGALASRMGNGNGRYVASALGGIMGAAIGNAIGGAVGDTRAQEVIVRLKDGRVVSVTQAESELTSGQSVYLVESSGKIRVIPAYVPINADKSGHVN